VCAAYFKFTPGFEDIKAFEITLGNGDPMFVVQATKSATATPKSEL
jgi:hypothetical protein